MQNVLEVYERPYNPRKPVVCLDEKSKQLLKDTRVIIAGKPGKSTRADYEYERNGTCNLFVAVEPKRGKRIVRVTKRRTKKDYASFIKYLVTHVYKKAKKIVLVEDNLNTHNKQTLIEVLGVKEGNKIARKIEWHFTPKHASWLDQAEIEIHALEQQCLNRRIPDFHTMQSEVAAWVKKRNQNECKINWQFTREKAKEKFKLK
ncbi:MAG TPA: IS630 family transposase [Patescibacteria group bacterium]|nr:IS630 family transposase [Patescibacteria group bacterium]